MSQPKSRAARKAVLFRAPSALQKAFRNPYREALAVACEDCKLKYRSIPAPRNIPEFHLVTSPVALTTYAERTRRDNVPHSYEVITEEDGRADASGSRQEWAIYPES